MIETATVSGYEGLTNNSPIAVGVSVITKKPSARKYMNHFSELLGAKQKPAFCILYESKTKRKAYRKGG